MPPYSTEMGVNGVGGYDANGNILSLRRRAPNAATGSATLVDNLTYIYTSGTNRLAASADAANTTAWANTPWDADLTTFTHNVNGNVTVMQERPMMVNGTLGNQYLYPGGYNKAHQPTSLTLRNGTQMRYRYDGAGQRITEQVGTAVGDRIVREGGVTFAVFSTSGTLKYWNLSGSGRIGGAGLAVEYSAEAISIEAMARVGNTPSQTLPAPNPSSNLLARPR